MHTFNPSTWEAEAGGSLSSRPAWSTELVLRQLVTQRNLVLKNKTKQNVIIFIWRRGYIHGVPVGNTWRSEENLQESVLPSHVRTLEIKDLVGDSF